MSEPLPAERQIDIWCVHSDRLAGDAGLFDAYRAALPDDEVERADRFVVERSRQEQLIARILVRSVLSHYTGHDLDRWRFTPNDYGKPAVAQPERVPLAFNLSHAEGLVVCAVTAGCELGVDTEKLDRRADHLTLARRFFAPAEFAAIDRSPPDEQAALFLRFWTLKEAFIKARGMGLSIPLADFAFELARDRPPQISFAASLEDRPDEWQFAELVIGGSHRVAVAARMPAGGPPTTRVRRTVPLRWHGEACTLPSTPTNAWTV